MTALGAPATSALAVPAVDLVPQSVLAPVAADPSVEARRAGAAERENREAERTRVLNAVTVAAGQRASRLSSQSAAVDQKAKAIKKARARAKARAVVAEKKRLAAVKEQGYEDGTTDPRTMARQILENKFGYGADQFSCFDWIIKRESGWNVRAQNPSSGAYGLPQSLPGSKMASVASDWRDNPATQIIWAAGYMKDRYGGPCGAKSYWEGAGNY